MPGMGPAPKPSGTARRRNPTIAMTRLPGEGRSGRAPKWPLAEDIAAKVDLRLAQEKADELESEISGCTDGRTRRRLEKELAVAYRHAAVLEAKLSAQQKLETELWTILWKSPQAVEWEKLGWDREVAQYVRWKVLAEMGNLDASKEARMLSDRLGLTPLSMLRLRWEVDEPEGKPKRTTTTRAKKKTGKDPRAVLYAVK